MRRDDPMYLAKYIRDNDLLDKPGWRHLCCYINDTNKTNRLLKAVKAKQRWNIVKTTFGMEIPREHKESMVFDDDNRNTDRKESEILKLKQIYKFDSFDCLGTVTSPRIPPGHTKIQVHLIYDYKKYG